MNILSKMCGSVDLHLLGVAIEESKAANVFFEHSCCDIPILSKHAQ